MGCFLLAHSGLAPTLRKGGTSLSKFCLGAAQELSCYGVGFVTARELSTPAEATGRLVRWVSVQQLVQCSASSPTALGLLHCGIVRMKCSPLPDCCSGASCDDLEAGTHSDNGVVVAYCFQSATDEVARELGGSRAC